MTDINSLRKCNVKPQLRKWPVADYWSNLCFQQWVPVFNTVIRGESLNSGPQNLALNKLEQSLYRMVLICWQIITSFCHKARIWQTTQAERQTDGKAIARACSNRVRCVLKNSINFSQMSWSKSQGQKKTKQKFLYSASYSDETWPAAL